MEMLNPLFFLYNIKNNPLDGLIAEFNKREWQFKIMPSDYMHIYQWPDIVLSDKVATLPSIIKGQDYTIELLGAYIPENKSNGSRVVLYMPKIRDTAKAFLHDTMGRLPSDPKLLDKYINLLSCLVLIHEFTHWIIIDCYLKSCENSEKEIVKQKLKYSTKDSVNYHESIAQIFTNYFCQSDPEMWELFLWLESKQPAPYTVYKKLIEHDAGDQVNDKVNDTIIDRIILSVMILRCSDMDYPKQSFRSFSNIYNKLNNVDFKKLFNVCVIIHVYNLWNWMEISFEAFLHEKRGRIVGKKYNL